MMKLGNLIEGLKTLQPYYNGDGYHIAVSNDQFRCFPTDKPLTPEDVQKMRDLGWFQPEQDDDDEYNAQEGWSAFT